MNKLEWMKKSYYKRRQICIQLLGGKCVRCHSRDRLGFDHIDKQLKRINITRILSYKWKTILEELEKCQLLCHDCHQLKNKIDNGECHHGSIGMYRNHRCRCLDCKSIWNLATKRWKLNVKIRAGAIGNTLVSETRDSTFKS